MNKSKTRSRGIVRAEIIGKSPEKAINFTRGGENIGLVKLNHVASEAWCKSIGWHMMTCAGFQMLAATVPEDDLP